MKDEDRNIVDTSRNGYTLNSDYNVWMDCLQFEELIQKNNSNEQRKLEQKIDIYQQALELYQGPFLNSEKVDTWLLKKRNYYHNLYLETVNKTAKYLSSLKKHKEVVDLYNIALRIYPYNVDLHRGIYENYKKAGKDNLARKQAEESIMLLREKDVQIPKRLENEVLQKKR